MTDKTKSLNQRILPEGGCFADTNWRYLPPYPFFPQLVNSFSLLMKLNSWKVKFMLENFLNFYKNNIYVAIVPSTGRFQIRVHPDIPRECRREAAFSTAEELDRLFIELYSNRRESKK